MKTKLYIIAFLSLSLIFGCSKLKEKVEEKVNKEVEKTAEDIKKQVDSTIKSAGEMDKEQKLKQALDDQKILDDPNGQWAIDATASSSYSSTRDGSWGVLQLTGKPNVETYGDNGYAWASKEQDKGIEWVELTYAKPVKATEIRVRQNYNPGAIIKVTLYDEKGNSEVVWEDVDKTAYTPNTIQWFTAKFDKTDYKTKKVRITLASNVVPGWNEIDAVQLVGE
jgi:hypothetical protein